MLHSFCCNSSVPVSSGHETLENRAPSSFSLLTAPHGSDFQSARTPTVPLTAPHGSDIQCARTPTVPRTPSPGKGPGWPPCRASGGSSSLSAGPVALRHAGPPGSRAPVTRREHTVSAAGPVYSLANHMWDDCSLSPKAVHCTGHYSRPKAALPPQLTNPGQLLSTPRSAHQWSPHHKTAPTQRHSPHPRVV